MRWFDRAKGYGFVNIFGRREDVFLHMATLQECGFGAVGEGNAIAVRVTAGRDGPTVCEVRDWGYVNRPRGRRRASHRRIATPASRSGPAFPDALNQRAAAAIFEILRAEAHGKAHGRPQTAPRVRAAQSDSEVEALRGLGYGCCCGSRRRELPSTRPAHTAMPFAVTLERWSVFADYL